MLTVYSASAGSGKTYTLSRRIIDILLRNPEAYQNVLAVTFTRKAALEMKERVIADLHLMGYGSAEEDKCKGLLQYHCRSLGEPIGTVQMASRRALLRILNDLAQLSLSTIDSFVQRVVRAFAFDQGLSASYALQIDDQELLREAVDLTMRDMATSPALREYMVGYAQRLVEEGGKLATIDRELFRAARQLVDGQHNLERCDLATCQNFAQALRAKQQEVRGMMKGLHSGLTAVVEELGVEGDDLVKLFTYGEKNPVLKAYRNYQRVVSTGDDNAWSEAGSGKDSDAEIFRLAAAAEWKKLFNKSTMVSGEMKNAVLEMSKSAAEMRKVWNTAQAVLANLDAMAVLGPVAGNLRKLCEANNQMLLANQGDLLRRLIDGASIPFIYERVGVRYNELMIDEFQDTNTTQYDNFKPLLDNSLAQGYDCLLVGDVKQSIYRFRHGDWRILGQRVAADYPQARFENLEANYRSLAEIVAFNNALFGLLPELMEVGLPMGSDETRFADLFAGATQQVKQPSGGFVRLKVYHNYTAKAHANGRPDAADMAAHVLGDAVRQVERLIGEYDYRLRDIAFLVRDGNDAARVTLALGAEGWPVISDDALQVMLSSSCRAVVNALRYIVGGDQVVFFNALSAYLDMPLEELASHFVGGAEGVPDDLCVEWANRFTDFKGLGLVEQIGALVAMLPAALKTADQAYIEVLEQKALEAVGQGSTSANDFLDLLDADGDKWSISSPADIDAVHLLTIHKAKGLEYPAVLVPFAGWAIDKSGQKEPLWVDKSHLGELSALWPAEQLQIKNTTDLENSHFQDDYYDEKRLTYVDNLNLAYVAFTRPTRTMMIWAVDTRKEAGGDVTAKAQYFGAYFSRAYDQLAEALEGQQLASTDAPETVTWSDGSGTTSSVECRSLTVGALTPMPQRAEAPESRKLPLLDRRLLTENVAMTTEVDAEEYERRQDMISYGLTMHSLMEGIETLADVDASVERAMLGGLIEARDAARVSDEIRSKLLAADVAPWFDGSSKAVYNEAVMVGGEARLRPDRVMLRPDGSLMVVDFKFGRRQEDKHREQVERYCEWLRRAGYDRINAALWYYTLDKVVKLTL